MRTVFADTFYFLAQFNPHDKAHGKATAFTNSYKKRMLTTDWVMVELGDAFAQPANRSQFVAIYQQLLASKDFILVPADRSLLQAGLAL